MRLAQERAKLLIEHSTSRNLCSALTVLCSEIIAVPVRDHPLISPNQKTQNNFCPKLFSPYIHQGFLAKAIDMPYGSRPTG